MPYQCLPKCLAKQLTNPLAIFARFSLQLGVHRCDSFFHDPSVQLHALNFLQGDCDWQAVTLDQLLQAELLHAFELDAEDGEHRPWHGVCHSALLPAVPV